MGVGFPSLKIQQAATGSKVMQISTNGPLATGGSDGYGMYVGVVNGNDPYGGVIDWGFTNLYPVPPVVAADTDRYILSTDVSSPVNFTREFANSTTHPVGHGFDPNATGELAACYSFVPLTNIPLKVIVLDDTCKSNAQGENVLFYGGGWVDDARYTWLTNELQAGQDANQLMIVACHIPIHVQTDPYTTNGYATMFCVDEGNQTETNMIATLNRYPNLILLMAGHRHMNTVTPQPSPDPSHPERGFWEVETASLRDFPQEFRTWEILRNADDSISIVTTDVDPVVQTNTPAGKSRAYAIGAARIYDEKPATNVSSYTYNVALVKQLIPAMKAVIHNYGRPLDHRVAISSNGVAFLGHLPSADNIHAPNWSTVPDATESPYPLTPSAGSRFYRAVEP